MWRRRADVGPWEVGGKVEGSRPCRVCLEAWGPRELRSGKVSLTEKDLQESHFRKR